MSGIERRVETVASALPQTELRPDRTVMLTALVARMASFMEANPKLPAGQVLEFYRKRIDAALEGKP